MMRQGSSPYVIQVLGVFKGRLPNSGPSTQLGLVMQFMERGTLALLQVIYIPTLSTNFIHLLLFLSNLVFFILAD